MSAHVCNNSFTVSGEVDRHAIYQLNQERHDQFQVGQQSKELHTEE